MLYCHVLPISNRFEVIQHFQFGWEIPIPSHFLVVFRVKHPQIFETRNFNTLKALPYVRPRHLIYHA